MLNRKFGFANQTWVPTLWLTIGEHPPSFLFQRRNSSLRLAGWHANHHFQMKIWQIFWEKIEIIFLSYLHLFLLGNRFCDNIFTDLNIKITFLACICYSTIVKYDYIKRRYGKMQSFWMQIWNSSHFICFISKI
jgi:hypothetical protein